MTEQTTLDLAQLFQDALKAHNENTKGRQASFATILQESTLTLEERDGLTQMSFLLPNAIKVRVSPLTIEAIGNHFLETLQTVEPGKGYSLRMETITAGSTPLGTEGIITMNHPSNNTHLERRAYRVAGLTKPIIGKMRSEHKVVIQPDLIGKREWEEGLRAYYQALQTIKELGIFS